MDTIDIKITKDNGLIFELLVNNMPLGEILNDGNEGIPHWIIDEGLPSWPPHESSSSYKIVTVCGCGEYGCGHSRCQVIEENDKVIFKDFNGDVGNGSKNLQFIFPRSSYDKVISEITLWTAKEKSKSKS